MVRNPGSGLARSCRPTPPGAGGGTPHAVRRLLMAAAGVGLGASLACATAPPARYHDDHSAIGALERADDRRGRFREIFCTVLGERSDEVEDARPCSEALNRIGAEPPGDGRPVELGPSRRRLVAAVVPGVGWECFSSWLKLEDTAAEHVRRFGFDLVGIPVGPMSSSAANARRIRDFVMTMDVADGQPRLVLIGYSKGAPDILEALVSYPEIHPRVAAVVAAAGAVRGSPIADSVTQSQLELLRHWPGADCPTGDHGALESLRPDVRRAWLDANPLPDGMPYYSLLTCPERDRISNVLVPGYRQLARTDPRNDGMLVLGDQFIPGSTLLGCVNADHWALAVPVERTHPAVSALFVEDNDFPREALLEALLRFVEEDLDRR